MGVPFFRCGAHARIGDLQSTPVRNKEHKPTISLNILSPAVTKGQREGKVKRSGSAKWRALVLLAVNVIIAARLAWWLANDQPSIISPVEPSEALAFAKDNVINAGLIFFIIMIVSTMILGRFFCGWACHFLAVQDASRWLLLKFGIRPKPFRSRLLALVPLGAFIYMFIWPLAYRGWLFAGNVRLRLGAGDSFSNALAWANEHPFAFSTPATELVRAGFWDTFPGIAVAIFSFAVAGGAIVYILGSKGFCYYACPYGGILGPADKLAPWRIRVNEDCTQSGHCTSVCSSNVRIHEEVRDYGMVVDPGCMKCLDCVSVCPNDALRYGIGMPALLAKPRRERKIRHSKDYTGREELALAALFLGTLYALHGLYDVFPFLISLGVSSILAYLLHSAARTFYKPTVRVLRVNLKLRGKQTKAGYAALAFAAVLIASLGHSAFIQYRLWTGTKLYNQNAGLRNIAINAGSPSVLSNEQRQDLERTLGYINKTLSSTPFPLAKQEIQQAWLYAALGPREMFTREALEATRGLRDPRGYELDVAQAHIRAGLFEQAEEIYRRVLGRDADDGEARAMLAELVFQNPQRHDEALALARTALDDAPESVRATMTLARLTAIVKNDVSRSIEILSGLAKVDGLTPTDISSVSVAMFELGAADSALAFVNEAAAKSGNPEVAGLLGVDILLAMERVDDARAAIDKLVSAPEPSIAVLRAGAGFYMSRAPDLEKALALVRAILDRQPYRPDTLTLEGDILDSMAREAGSGLSEEQAEALDLQARESYRAALERVIIEKNTSPQNPAPYRDLGALYARLGDYEAAQRTAVRATELNPNDASAWQLLTVIYGELGNPEAKNEAQKRVEALTSGFSGG